MQSIQELSSWKNDLGSVFQSLLSNLLTWCPLLWWIWMYSVQVHQLVGESLSLAIQTFFTKKARPTPPKFLPSQFFHQNRSGANVCRVLQGWNIKPLFWFSVCLDFCKHVCHIGIEWFCWSVYPKQTNLTIGPKNVSSCEAGWTSFTAAHILLPNTHAQSSNLEIDSARSGVTLSLAARWVVSVIATSFTQMYTAQHIASLLASQKVCNCILRPGLNCDHLLILIFGTSNTCWSHPSHTTLSFAGSCWSQSTFCCQISCRMTLAWTVKGAIIPWDHRLKQLLWQQVFLSIFLLQLLLKWTYSWMLLNLPENIKESSSSTEYLIPRTFPDSKLTSFPSNQICLARSWGQCSQ